MRIAVFGATGMAGGAITEEAARRSHDVTALSRHPHESTSPHIKAAVCDVADVEAMGTILEQVDAAVLAIRPAQGHEGSLPTLTTGILDAAQQSDVPLLIVGGAAPLWSPNSPDLRVLDDPSYVPPAWRTIAQASIDQFEACRRHPYSAWTYFSPPAIFEPGERTGNYARGTNTLLVDQDGSSRISAADFAIAVLDELENPGPDSHVTVATMSAGEVQNR